MADVTLALLHIVDQCKWMRADFITGQTCGQHFRDAIRMQLYSTSAGSQKRNYTIAALAIAAPVMGDPENTGKRVDLAEPFHNACRISSHDLQ